MDHETRARDDDHDALRLWLRLLTCTNLIEGQIRRQLRSQHDCTLPRFDLLAQLARTPEGLRMGELSRRLMVTGGNVTGIVDQLEADGLLQREPAPKDRRAVVIQLTDRGRQEFARMARDHEQWVVDLLGGLDERQLHQLHALLGILKSHLKASTELE